MKGLLFTYALTYGGAVVALFNPFVGLLVYVCFGILKPDAIWYYSVPPGNYSRIIAIALLIGWGMQGFGNWNFGNGRHLVFLMLGFFGWFTLSSLFTAFPDNAWPQVEGFAKIVLPCVVGATLINSRERLRQLAWVITLSAGFWAFRENERYLAGEILEVKNQIAHIFAVGAGIALFVGFIEQRRIPRLIAFACAGLLFHGALFHMSRGAMLGLVIVGLVGVYLIPKTPEVVRWLFLATVAGVIMAGPSVQQEFSTIFATAEERDYSAQSRFDLWSAMWRCALVNPVTGVGLQAWPKVAPHYGFPEGKQGHGLWIQALAETGFPGGVMYFAFFGCCIFSLWRYLRRPPEEIDPEYRLYAIMVIATLCGWMVEAQFGSFYGVELPYYVVMMGIGVLRLTSVPQISWEMEPHFVATSPTMATSVK